MIILVARCNNSFMDDLIFDRLPMIAKSVLSSDRQKYFSLVFFAEKPLHNTFSFQGKRIHTIWILALFN